MREPTRGTSQNSGFRFSGKEVTCLPLPVVEPQKGRRHEQQEELVLLLALYVIQCSSVLSLSRV